MSRPSYGLAMTIALVLAVADCRQSTEPDHADTTTQIDPPPAGYARFAGIINDASGLPLPGFTVAVPFGADQAWQGTTDANGHYDFVALASDFEGVRPVVMVVYKDRYLPRTFYYERVEAGNVLTLTTTAASAPRPLQVNEFVPTYGLWHVGDEAYSGAVNSRLQMATFGLGIGFRVTPWSAQLAQQYRNATLEFAARGIEGSGCPGDAAGLYARGGTQLDASARLGDSDPNGGFSRYRLTVPIPSVPTGTDLMFGVVSGSCPSTGDAGDDFEFTDVLVTLSP